MCLCVSIYLDLCLCISHACLYVRLYVCMYVRMHIVVSLAGIVCCSVSANARYPLKHCGHRIHSQIRDCPFDKSDPHKKRLRHTTLRFSPEGRPRWLLAYRPRSETLCPLESSGCNHRIYRAPSPVARAHTCMMPRFWSRKHQTLSGP